MARTVKDPQERREEFLATAQQLFIERGYYATSVDDIAGRMGVAKGLFYYYFRSKEDLVEQIVDSLWEGAVEDYERIRDRDDLNGLEKLLEFSHVRGEVKLQQTYLVEVYLKDPDSPIVRGMRERGYDILIPILGEIISQGVEEGAFDTEYPEEVAAFLVRGAESLMSTDLGDEEAVIRSFLISLDIWERVLGTEKGAFMVLLERHEDTMRGFATAAGRMDARSDGGDDAGDD